MSLNSVNVEHGVFGGELAAGIGGKGVWSSYRAKRLS